MEAHRSILALALPLILTGCGGDTYDLHVDVVTDYRPGYDFASVRVTVDEGPSAVGLSETWEHSGDAADFLEGARVADLRGLSAGLYTVRVELLDATGAVVVTDSRRVPFDGSLVITLLFTTACASPSCPEVGDDPDATACLNGECVRPECVEPGAEGCDDVGCGVDGECDASVACAEPRCVVGACLQEPNDARCADGEYCDVSDGCRPVPVTPTDGGTPPGDDAGTCDPAACDDGDPCTLDTCTAGACAHPPRCAAAEYCLGGGCYPLPALDFETVESAGCIDLGVAHPSGTNFVFRRTVQGRPGASAQQYNEHVSCGDPVEPAERFSLDALGDHQYPFYASSPLSDCWSEIYGRWYVHVRVDGQRSNVEEAVYYNSSCPNVATCAAARGFCSPCRFCDLGATEYCYAGTSCAPVPTLSIATPEAGGCVDLGVEHISPPALNVVIDGRPGATSIQHNRHASCSGPRVPSSDNRMLDATGHVEDPLLTGAVTDCADTANYGLWRVDVEVDGERSNTVDVVYYNSNCGSGFSTCTAARSFCGT